MGVVHDASARLSLDIAAMAASSLLCIFDRIRFGPDLSPSLVAALLVQHPLWNGDAARVCTWTWFRGRNSCIAVVREFKRSSTRFAAAALYAIVAMNAWAVLRDHPLTYVEGTKNIESRRAFEVEIPPVLRSLLATRPGGVVLMETSVYPNLVAFSGIPLRQTINESDKEYYSAALAAPATHAAIVLAFDGDEIDQAVKAHPAGLELIRDLSSRTEPWHGLRLRYPAGLQTCRAVIASAKVTAMCTTLANISAPFDFSWLQQLVVFNGAIPRLIVASALGGLIGLEREVKRRSAGVRTNLLICMGAAFFTLLSAVLAGDGSPNKGQVASNIVQGIGFLGAGLIIHNRSRISGLTSAASVWVVASIGMACGAGLLAAAAVATVIVIIALELVGFLERRASIKIYSLIYEARGADQTAMLRSILDAMDKAGERLADFATRRDRRSAAREFHHNRNQEAARASARETSLRTRHRLTAQLPRSGGRLIPFAKAHACGNDFLIVTEDAAAKRDWSDLSRQLCARNTGVGADGVEFFAWTGSKSGRIRLHNADGSIAEISGNGTRCVAAWMSSMIGAKIGDELRIETDAGLRICRINGVRSDGGYSVEVTTGMGIPSAGA